MFSTRPRGYQQSVPAPVTVEQFLKKNHETEDDQAYTRYTSSRTGLCLAGASGYSKGTSFIVLWSPDVFRFDIRKVFLFQLLPRFVRDSRSKPLFKLKWPAFCIRNCHLGSAHAHTLFTYTPSNVMSALGQNEKQRVRHIRSKISYAGRKHRATDLF